jgi:hypothetical protein
MMDKQSKLNIPCTYCDKDALPDTDPPACAEHKDMAALKKKASESGGKRECEHDTLKELTAADK